MILLLEDEPDQAGAKNLNGRMIKLLAENIRV